MTRTPRRGALTLALSLFSFLTRTPRRGTPTPAPSLLSLDAHSYKSNTQALCIRHKLECLCESLLVCMRYNENVVNKAVFIELGGVVAGMMAVLNTIGMVVLGTMAVLGTKNENAKVHKKGERVHNCFSFCLLSSLALSKTARALRFLVVCRVASLLSSSAPSRSSSSRSDAPVCAHE